MAKDLKHGTDARVALQKVSTNSEIQLRSHFGPKGRNVSSGQDLWRSHNHQ